ncbi:hypothetical protein EDM56_02615 [Brevibacillus fluminis]|uniref:Uncharacterized protein n=1 Tax=Brevibacillus fluminis TaxID=511487 RepID=A0A3M8DU93_9BACL|nr:hypothetical protein [Brevibacillus fluminis]RNB91666.1 hypothetical protein EDM56_02615 [Brevibacillus fluminis]
MNEQQNQPLEYQQQPLQHQPMQHQLEHHFQYPIDPTQYSIEQVRFGFGGFGGAGWILPLLFLTPFFFNRGGGYGGGYDGANFAQSYPLPYPYPYPYPLPTYQSTPGFPTYPPYY